MTQTEAPRAACTGMHSTFASNLVYAHIKAAPICLGRGDKPACPILAQCREMVAGEEIPDGTWGGDLYSNGTKIREAGERLKA